MKARLLTLSVVVTAFLLALVNAGIGTSPGR
jgi:predicted small secreted protein